MDARRRPNTLVSQRLSAPLRALASVYANTGINITLKKYHGSGKGIKGAKESIFSGEAVLVIHDASTFVECLSVKFISGPVGPEGLAKHLDTRRKANYQESIRFTQWSNTAFLRRSER